MNGQIIFPSGAWKSLNKSRKSRRKESLREYFTRFNPDESSGEEDNTNNPSESCRNAQSSSGINKDKDNRSQFQSLNRPDNVDNNPINETKVIDDILQMEQDLNIGSCGSTSEMSQYEDSDSLSNEQGVHIPDNPDPSNGTPQGVIKILDEILQLEKDLSSGLRPYKTELAYYKELHKFRDDCEDYIPDDPGQSSGVAQGKKRIQTTIRFSVKSQFTVLRNLLERKLNQSLCGYGFSIKDSPIMTDKTSLADHHVKGKGYLYLTCELKESIVYGNVIDITEIRSTVKKVGPKKNEDSSQSAKARKRPHGNLNLDESRFRHALSHPADIPTPMTSTSVGQRMSPLEITLPDSIGQSIALASTTAVQKVSPQSANARNKPNDNFKLDGIRHKKALSDSVGISAVMASFSVDETIRYFEEALSESIDISTALASTSAVQKVRPHITKARKKPYNNFKLDEIRHKLSTAMASTSGDQSIKSFEKALSESIDLSAAMASSSAAKEGSPPHITKARKRPYDKFKLDEISKKLPTAIASTSPDQSMRSIENVLSESTSLSTAMASTSVDQKVRPTNARKKHNDTCKLKEMKQKKAFSDSAHISSAVTSTSVDQKEEPHIIIAGTSLHDFKFEKKRRKGTVLDSSDLSATTADTSADQSMGSFLKVLAKDPCFFKFRPNQPDQNDNFLHIKQANSKANSPKTVLIGCLTKEGRYKFYGSGNTLSEWQFLIECLSYWRYRSIIMWIGSDGEFEILNPKLVAKLWGSRTKEYSSDFSRFYRAMRYSYDNYDKIRKVPQSKYRFKFICDLQKLIGFSAAELKSNVLGAITDAQRNPEIFSKDTSVDETSSNFSLDENTSNSK